jgi:hypothetical protein
VDGAQHTKAWEQHSPCHAAMPSPCMQSNSACQQSTHPPPTGAPAPASGSQAPGGGRCGTPGAPSCAPLLLLHCLAQEAPPPAQRLAAARPVGLQHWWGDLLHHYLGRAGCWQWQRQLLQRWWLRLPQGAAPDHPGASPGTPPSHPLTPLTPSSHCRNELNRGAHSRHSECVPCPSMYTVSMACCTMCHATRSPGFQHNHTTAATQGIGMHAGMKATSFTPA